MKHLYLTMATLMACAMTLQAAKPNVAQLAGVRTEATKSAITQYNTSPAKVKQNVTVEEIFAAPENTVLDGPYLPKQAKWMGFHNSDLGRPGMATRFYQAFHGCHRTVSSLRVIGMFSYCDPATYQWYHCESRGGIDENYNLTEPVTFEVAFYREDENGEPGEVVYKKNIDIVGRCLGIMYDYSDDNSSPMYEFTADLGEEIKLECGFMSFAAADIGDSPTCWFSLLTTDTSIDFGISEIEDYGMIRANLPCVFSFMGNGDMAAGKALRVDRLTSPVIGDNGTHEKVTVYLTNVGAQAIDDACLELWIDGELMATEKVNASIPSEGNYAYTFMHRVDLSNMDDHEIVVKNVTPGDEKISRQQASAIVYAISPDEVCESSSTYVDNNTFISRVTIENIDNKTEPGQYTDYSNSQVFEMRPGETYHLDIEPQKVATAGVWIDWNENGLFSDAGEMIGTIYDKGLELSIPDGMSVTPGKKRMRIVMDSSQNPQPCGNYYFGETEDYGVNVTRNDNTPVVEVSFDEISEFSDGKGIKETSLNLANTGSADLNATISVDYTLPFIYENHVMPASGKFAGKPIMKRSDTKVYEPAQEETVQLVLSYDSGFDASVGIGNYNSAVFAQYYPSDIMKSIKGMKVSSIDVYFDDVPEKASVKLYGQNSFGVAGNIIAEQEFVPIADSWNHIVLDTPVEITGEDLWYSVELTGMVDGVYYIGIDNIPAVAGYGDLCLIDGHCWSMSDIGIDHNLCIRANVTGERTAAINWLDTDLEETILKAGESTDFKVYINAEGLQTAVYEASIKIASNDELMPVVSIPVYLTNKIATGIDTSRLNKTNVRVADGNIVITSDDNIAYVNAFDMAGRAVASTTTGRIQRISLGNFSAGVYMISVVYVDDSRETFKIVVAR